MTGSDSSRCRFSNMTQSGCWPIAADDSLAHAPPGLMDLSGMMSIWVSDHQPHLFSLFPHTQRQWQLQEPRLKFGIRTNILKRQATSWRTLMTVTNNTVRQEHGKALSGFKPRTSRLRENLKNILEKKENANVCVHLPKTFALCVLRREEWRNVDERSLLSKCVCVKQMLGFSSRFRSAFKPRYGSTGSCTEQPTAPRWPNLRNPRKEPSLTSGRSNNVASVSSSVTLVFPVPISSGSLTKAWLLSEPSHWSTTAVVHTCDLSTCVVAAAPPAGS